MGFYNAFAARATGHSVCHPSVYGAVEVSRDGATGEMHAMRSARFQSMQFHAESVLSRDGLRVLREVLTGVLPGASTDVNRR